jgi:hypothetical protein
MTNPETPTTEPASEDQERLAIRNLRKGNPDDRSQFEKEVDETTAHLLNMQKGPGEKLILIDDEHLSERGKKARKTAKTIHDLLER